MVRHCHISVLPIEMLAGNASSSSRSVRRIAAGARVSGTFGELQSNPNPNIKRRVKKRVFGNVIGAVDAKKYRVDFDNIGVLEVYLIDFALRLQQHCSLLTSFPVAGQRTFLLFLLFHRQHFVFCLHRKCRQHASWHSISNEVH